MSGNRFLQDDDSSLLKGKLEKIAKDLQVSISSSGFQTQEAYLSEVIRVLNSFYRTLTSPQLKVEDVAQDQLPNIIWYQQLWSQLLDDLTVIFTEIENIESLTVSNFNYIATEANRLTSRLKAVSSKLGDYILYSTSPTKDVAFFKDSFNDLSKIDIGSSLLNSSQCSVHQSEGILTLPIDNQENPAVRVSEVPIIDPLSNGTPGNNHQLGAAYNGVLSVILDNNPDTWYEYEDVVSSTIDEPLRLQLTINLGREEVVNNIRISPNNFGTKTVIQVISIDTSIDGQVYTSIKDDITTPDFIEGEGDPFTLAPATSKFAGQGIYTFTPRKMRYARIHLEQSEPYVIQTTTGDKLRYAIGLRDIIFNKYKYFTAGEIISNPFDSLLEIRKVLLQVNQLPSSLSELVKITYFISPDNGGSWHQIQPKELEGTAGVLGIPEVLNFNSTDRNSLSTIGPVTSLRLKIKLEREDIAFDSGSSTLRKKVSTRAESHTIPVSAPFQFVLEKPPVDESISIIDPFFGSRGLEKSPYYLGHTSDNLNMRTYRLPFKSWPRPVKKVQSGGVWHIEPVPASEWLNIEVGGEEWSHATQALSLYGTSDRVFLFDHDAGEIRFGNGTNGTLPGSNEPIAVWLDAEQLFPSATEDAHIAQLEFPTSSSKHDIKIKRYGKIAQITETIPRKATVIHLANKYIQSIVQVDPDTTFTDGNQQDFVNGREELTLDGHWSIDTEEGIIYSYSPTSNSSDITITYTYQPIAELTEDDWEWASSSLLRDSILIRESGWRTLSVLNEDITLETNSTIVDLEHLGIVRGTVLLALIGATTATNPFIKEVPYIDGKEELGLVALQTTQQLASHTGSGIEGYSLEEDITTSTSYAVAFSESTVFSDLKTSYGSLVNNGDYYTDRTNGIVYLYSDVAIADPGKVTYYYTNPRSRDNGLYSINYRLGVIHTQRVMDSSWSLSAQYEYTDFRAEYRIARVLDKEHYEVDLTNRQVRIKDGEILQALQTPRAMINTFTPFYIINYDYIEEVREDIEGLKDYYSPIVRDYSIKALTKSRIF